MQCMHNVAGVEDRCNATARKYGDTKPSEGRIEAVGCCLRPMHAIAQTLQGVFGDLHQCTSPVLLTPMLFAHARYLGTSLRLLALFGVFSAGQVYLLVKEKCTNATDWRGSLVYRCFVFGFKKSWQCRISSITLASQAISSPLSMIGVVRNTRGISDESRGLDMVLMD